MDGTQFDDLTRILAISRRGVLRALAGSAAGGLLAFLSRAEATAKQPPRPRPPRPPRPPRGGICRRRDDGEPCGRGCGSCQGGQCVPDDTNCQPCHICDATFACAPQPDGERCGQDCGVCEGGRCFADDKICGVGDHRCTFCDSSVFTCRTFRDGITCGPCATCQGGQCQPDDARCNAECEVCDADSLTCVPAPMGEACGVCLTCQGGACQPAPDAADCGAECGACLSGTCQPDDQRCASVCRVCAGPSMTCEPANDGALCEGACGTCEGGTCLPDPGRCDPGCELCDPNSLNCIPRPDGTVCRPNAVCQGGTCVDLPTCEFPMVTCFDVDGFGGSRGPPLLLRHLSRCLRELLHDPRSDQSGRLSLHRAPGGWALPAPPTRMSGLPRAVLRGSAAGPRDLPLHVGGLRPRRQGLSKGAPRCPTSR